MQALLITMAKFFCLVCVGRFYSANYHTLQAISSNTRKTDDKSMSRTTINIKPRIKFDQFLLLQNQLKTVVWILGTPFKM